MLLNSELLYNLRLRHQPMCGQILEDYNLWKSFINNLDNKIRNNLIIRPHPSHDSWNLIKKCNEDFGENYISKKSFLKDDTNRAKIIVDTHIQSPFFENMKTGIPMITLFNRSILNMDNKIKKDDQNDLIYTGCQIINKSLFESYSVNNFSISEVWNKLITKNKLYGYESSEKFFHLTNLKVYRDLLKNK